VQTFLARTISIIENHLLFHYQYKDKRILLNMLQIDNFLYASSLSEAYVTLLSVPGSVVLGGCGYLRLGARSITTAIDLSRLDLDFVRATENGVEIGAMTTLRTLEIDSLTASLYNGVLKSSVKNIVGVQLRSGVTIGGTVAGRYPFSDPITALMALDAQLIFYKHGQISLEQYLAGKNFKDILEKIIIPKDGRLAVFTSIRKTKTDFAVLNVAVSKKGDSYRIIVGSRPGRAMNASAAADLLTNKGLNSGTAAEAGRLAAEELRFGDNPRGSGQYRKAVCPVLIQRALTELIEVTDAA
jgi:CO/xanthine dehydrogenase FAD-binding subunit